MSFKGNRRKKPRERQNRKTLYEKHIPCISGAIEHIIAKSRNREFKMHCQQLLKVDNPNMIQDAISSKLFMLSLGKNLESTSRSQSTQEYKLHACSTSDADTAFADLADHDHLENNIAQWSFLGAPSPYLENVPEELHQTNSIREHYTEKNQVEPKENLRQDTIVTEYQEVRTTDKASNVLDEADIATANDDFEWLEDDTIFSEFPSRGEMRVENHDQKVPCYNEQTCLSDECDAHGWLFKHHQSVIPEQTGNTKNISGDNDDQHFETLGIFM